MHLHLLNIFVIALILVATIPTVSARHHRDGHPLHEKPGTIYMVRYRGDECLPHYHTIIDQNDIPLGKCFNFKKNHAMDKVRFELPDKKRLFDETFVNHGTLRSCRVHFYGGHACEGEPMKVFDETDELECLAVDNAHSVRVSCVPAANDWDDEDEVHVNNTLPASRAH